MMNTWLMRRPLRRHRTTDEMTAFLTDLDAHLGERPREQGAVRLHFGVEQDFRPARKAHPAFRVADLDALRRRLEAAGVAIVDDEALPGERRFYAADPFGNRLEFLAEIGSRPTPDRRA